MQPVETRRETEKQTSEISPGWEIQKREGNNVRLGSWNFFFMLED